MITYDKLFDLLEKRDISARKLRKETGISSSDWNAYLHGGGMSTHTINRLCRFLSCQPGDILTYIPDEEEPSA